MVIDDDPERKTGEQVQDVFLRRDGLNGDANIPTSPEGGCISDDLLPGLRLAGREDRAGAGIPPERIRSRVREELPDPFDRCINCSNRTRAKARGNLWLS